MLSESSYLVVVRKLIQTYTLEPAGSHGVWGLDDHSFVSYIFGSAQYSPAISGDDAMPTEGSLRVAPKPGDVVKKNIVDEERQHNMYFSAVGFINDVKTGPFWEHSPMLFDISGVPQGWGKINKVSSSAIFSCYSLMLTTAGNAQDVQRRSAFQVSSRSAFSIWLTVLMGDRP